MTAPPLLPEYTPHGVNLAQERSNLLGLVLSGVAYGVLFTLFLQCATLIVKAYSEAGSSNQSRRHRNEERRAHLPWLVYTVAMFTLASIGFGGAVEMILKTFIDYRDIPGGPNVFHFTYFSLDPGMASFVSYSLMSWLGDGLLLYRFMLFYNFKPWICFFPTLVYMGVISMSISLMISVKTGGDIWGPRTIQFGVAYWSLSIGLNIGLTTLIAGRLLALRSRVKKVLGRPHSAPYLFLLSMLVESAALYSLWGLVFIILYSRKSHVQNIVLPSLGQVQGIAPLLIIFRLGKGKAWNRDTVNTTIQLTGIELDQTATQAAAPGTVTMDGSINFSTKRARIQGPTGSVESFNT